MTTLTDVKAFFMDLYMSVPGMAIELDGDVRDAFLACGHMIEGARTMLIGDGK